MLRKGVVKNTKTGEIVLCVEAEEGVPMGSEAGFPRRGIREDWPIILLLIAVPALIVLIVLIIITGIIHVVSGL